MFNYLIPISSTPLLFLLPLSFYTSLLLSNNKNSLTLGCLALWWLVINQKI